MIGDSWASLLRQLDIHVPRFRPTLRAGATAKALADLESELRRPLPADVRELLLLHDGQGRSADRGSDGEMLSTHTLNSCGNIEDAFRSRYGVGAVMSSGVYGPVAPSLSAFFDDLAARLADGRAEVEDSGTDDAAVCVDDYNPAYVPDRFPSVGPDDSN